MSIHTKTAFDYVRRSPFQAIAALFVLSLTFFVATTMAVLVYASGQALKYFETRPQIISFLKNDTSEEAIAALENKLNSDSRVKDVHYVAKEQALEIYKQATSDNPLLAELVSPSIFPASLEFSVLDLSKAQEVIDEVKKEAIVDNVGFTANLGGQSTLGDAVSRLKTIAYYVRLSGVVFVSVLGVTSFMVLLVIIGMRMTVRKGEIEILNLIGATSGFIRSPIVIEALIYSLIGVFLGWLISFIMWLYLTPSVISYFGQIPILPTNPTTFFILFGSVLGGELVVGIVIALTGSLVAVKRSLKTKK